MIKGDFDLATVPFNFNSRDESFRTTITSKKQENEEEIFIWFENKRSKEQWAAAFKNVSDCGPSGFPAVAVFEALKVQQDICKCEKCFLLTICLECSDVA